MNLPEAKEQFISSWGTLGSNWGVSKTMAQIHALLMISTEPLSTEDIMGALNISRGNTNMNYDLYNFWLNTPYQMMYLGETVAKMDLSSSFPLC